MPREPETNQSSEDFAATFPNRAKAYYEIALARRNEQSQWARTLDTRLAASFSLSAVIVAIFAAAMVIAQSDPPVPLVGISAFVLFLFAASTFCGYMAFRSSRWEKRPDLRDVQTRVRQSEAHQWFLAASDIVAAYYADAVYIEGKEKWTKRSVRVTALNAVVVSIGATLAIVLSGGSC